MKVLGQEFYDMETREIVEFGIVDVLAVVIQPVFDEDANEMFWLVIAFMKDARFVSTKPITDELLALAVREAMFVMDEQTRF